MRICLQKVGLIEKEQSTRTHYSPPLPSTYAGWLAGGISGRATEDRIGFRPRDPLPPTCAARRPPTTIDAAFFDDLRTSDQDDRFDVR